MKTRNELELIGLSSIGKFLYYIGVIKLVGQYNKVCIRILHPVGLLFTIFYIVVAPIMCMFTESDLKSAYKDYIDTLILF